MVGSCCMAIDECVHPNGAWFYEEMRTLTVFENSLTSNSGVLLGNWTNWNSNQFWKLPWWLLQENFFTTGNTCLCYTLFKVQPPIHKPWGKLGASAQ